MNSRIRSIEGCRGIAAILVLLSHFAAMFYPAMHWGEPYAHLKEGIDYIFGQLPFFTSGDSGVSLFFVITGFGTYIAVDSGKINIRKYLLLRYFKLLLLTLLGALPIWLLMQTGCIFVHDIADSIKTPWFHGWPPQEQGFMQAVLGNPLASLASYNGALWTMPYFLWGTFLSFVLAQLFSGSFRENLSVFLIVVLTLSNLLEFYYIACAAGAFLGYCYKHFPEQFQQKCRYWQIIFILCMYLGSYPSGFVGDIGFFLQHDSDKAFIIYHVISATLFAACALSQGLLKKILETAPLQWLGHYSMGIYLIHYPILVSLIALLYSLLPENLSYLVGTSLLFCIFTIATLMAAVPAQLLMNRLFSLLSNVYNHIF